MRNLKITIVLGLAALAVVGCVDSKPEKKVAKNVQYVSGPDEVTYRKIGEEIIDSVQLVLKSNLMKAMEKGGPENAVKFCNTRALDLTATYSDKYNTEVRRVSDKFRNPKNEPSEKESAVIADFKAMLANGEPALPKVSIDADGNKHFYAPIFTGGLCLACHGNPKNMQPELVSTIDSLYPNDNAKGYAVDELRGVWSIKFKNS